MNTQTTEILQTQLLRAMKEEDTIKFTFSRNQKGDISLLLDGHSQTPELFQSRVAAILNSSYGASHKFSKNHETVSKNKTKEEAPSIKFSIRPCALPLSSIPEKALGFGESSKHSGQATADNILIPEFMTNGPETSPIHPLSILTKEPSFTKLEISFTRIPLAQPTKELLTRSIGEQILVLQQIYGHHYRPTPKLVYLTEWANQGKGWFISLHVTSDRDNPVDLGVLELIGREFFHADCQIEQTNRTSSYPPFKTGNDLSQAYPVGWEFPLIPSIKESTRILKAKPRFHTHLPKLPKKGAIVGIANDEAIRLPEASRDRHTYIAGATGTGKTTLLHRLIQSDLRKEESLILLDPHGDLYQEISDSIPPSREKDVVRIDPTSAQKPLGWNILDIEDDGFIGQKAQLLVDELLNLFQEIWKIPEAFGPMFQLYFRNALLLLIHQKNQPYQHTLYDFERIFIDEDFRNELARKCTENNVGQFWQKTAGKVQGECSLVNIAPYITSKISIFTQGGTLSEMITQSHDDLQLEKKIEEGKIILVNLNKGQMGVNESRLLGVLLTQRIFSACLKRSKLTPDERRPVNIYIDEFQNFVSDNIASMLSESRKFGLRLNLANQTLSQLESRHRAQNLLETVLGNVGNMIVFRVGVPDTVRLTPFLAPFKPAAIQKLPNYHALIRLLDEQGPVGPLVMETLPPLNTPNNTPS